MLQSIRTSVHTVTTHPPCNANANANATPDCTIFHSPVNTITLHASTSHAAPDTPFDTAFAILFTQPIVF